MTKQTKKVNTPEKEIVQFVSYSGQYPHLCKGTLVILVGKTTYKLKDVLVSGGFVEVCEDGKASIEEGPWEFNSQLNRIPLKLQQYYKEILSIVNCEIEHGCCGGCV
jgi:hypothetical protein